MMLPSLKTIYVGECKDVKLLVPNNFCISFGGYYISYLTNSPDYENNDTTALVRCDGILPDKFLILNGNHMANYKKLNSYKECLSYFISHIDEKNPKSEDWKKEFSFSEKEGIKFISVVYY